MRAGHGIMTRCILKCWEGGIRRSKIPDNFFWGDGGFWGWGTHVVCWMKWGSSFGGFFKGDRGGLCLFGGKPLFYKPPPSGGPLGKSKTSENIHDR